MSDATADTICQICGVRLGDDGASYCSAAHGARFWGKSQTTTEWWVCCYQEDVDHLGGVERVPAETRFVACKNEFGDGPRWSLAGCLHGPENHWIVPIKKVELT